MKFLWTSSSTRSTYRYYIIHSDLKTFMLLNICQGSQAITSIYQCVYLFESIFEYVTAQPVETVFHKFLKNAG